MAVLADLEDVSKLRGRDGRSRTAALRDFIRRNRHRTMPENCAKRQQVRIAVEHDAPIDARDGFQNGLRKLSHTLLAQKIVKLIFRSGGRRLLWRMEQIT